MSTPELPPWAWFACYAMAVVCTLASVLLAVYPRAPVRGWRWVRLSLVLLVVPLVSHIDASGEHWVPIDLQMWARLGTFALGIALVVLLLSHESWFARYPKWQRWGRPAFLLSCSLAATIVIGVRFHDTTEPPIDDKKLSDLVRSQKIPRPVDDLFGVTDLGRSIPLMRFAGEALGAEAAELVPESFRLRVIVAGTDDSPANCHGWVFTGGQYLVQSRYVDMILQDNGYRIVTEPRVGDLIVYRDELGDPIHTGVVKAVGNDGFALIESKWGALDTYLHLPQDQVYSKGYAYYRSVREGHQLHLIMHSAAHRPNNDSPPPSPPPMPEVEATPAVNG